MLVHVRVEAIWYESYLRSLKWIARREFQRKFERETLVHRAVAAIDGPCPMKYVVALGESGDARISTHHQ